MNREFKGTGVNHYIEDYCVLDLETTGVFVSSAKIIEISAFRVRQGFIVKHFCSLVNPHCPIPPEATAVNHITNDMVKDAPDLESIIDSFIAFVGDDVIVGYNNAGFDMNIIYDQMMSLRGIPFENNYIDVLHAARRCISDVENHKLETVCKYFGFDTTGEHRALKDCYLTKACYDRLYQEYGTKMFSHRRSISDNESRKAHFSSETLALQALQKMLEAIIADGVVTHTEFYALQDWVEEHRDLQGIYPFDRVFNALDKVLEDGIVSPDELKRLQVLFSDYVDPVKSMSCHDEITSINDKHVCVTGDFDYGSRTDVHALIEQAGGIIDKTVKKCTDYVVVGASGSANWKTGNYGSKIQKALQWNDKGAEIKIVEEAEFISSLKAIINQNEENEAYDE